MGLRYRPRIKIGNATIGKTGVSFRTGIPGLTFRHDFKKSGRSSARSYTQSDNEEPTAPTVGSVVKNVLLYMLLVVIGSAFWCALFGKWFIVLIAVLSIGFIYPQAQAALNGQYKGIYLGENHKSLLGAEAILKTVCLLIVIGVVLYYFP